MKLEKILVPLDGSPLAEAAAKYLEEIEERLATTGVTHVDGTVWYEPAALAIVEAARFHQVSMIVMTTHGRTVLRGTTTPIPLLRAEGAAVEVLGGNAEARPSSITPLEAQRLAEAVVNRAERDRTG